MTITVHVEGMPKAQPRPRYVLKGRKVVVVSTTGEATRLYVEKVRQACRRALADHDGKPPIEAAHVRLDFYFESRDPTRFGQPHTAKPDCDNLGKLWLDAAQHKTVGLLPKGDERVASLTITKRWARNAGTIMVLEPCAADRLDDGLDQDDDDLGAEKFMLDNNV